MLGDDKSTLHDTARQKAQLSGGPSTVLDAAFIALCGASYAKQSSIVSKVAEVAPWDGTGRWKCVWGPAYDLFKANLAFVAAYLSNDTGLPICAALVIRGTDATEKIGDFIEGVEDLHTGIQVAYPLAEDPTVKVAKGTIEGLDIIKSLVDPSTKVALPDFITDYFRDAQDDNPVLVVTGHSLGGCLTTVVAPWAKTLVRGDVPIKTVTFAAPTAGNSNFAAWYASAIPNNTRYYNTLDVVPMAWNNLPEILTMFAGGPPIPGVAHDVVCRFIKDTAGLTYSQTNPSHALDGTPCGKPNWYDEAFAQHNHATYISLMAGGGSNCSITSQDLQDMIATGDPKLVKS